MHGAAIGKIHTKRVPHNKLCCSCYCSSGEILQHNGHYKTFALIIEWECISEVGTFQYKFQSEQTNPSPLYDGKEDIVWYCTQ